jgi:putative CocE/NonD family hydrolase
MPDFRSIFHTLRAVRPLLVNAIKEGRLFNPRAELTKAHPDILCEYDVEIPMSDGTVLTANVFRSKAAAQSGEPLPVVMCAHPYDNHLIAALGNTPLGGPPKQYRIIPQRAKPKFSELTSWESPDPNFWVPAGYAVVNLNLPGFSNSGGKPTLFSTHEATCFTQAIEWIAAQPWSTGKVGLSGVSYLAISQYYVAAGQGEGGVPSALCAISPWEGVTDLYRDMFYEGGIREQGFPVFWWNLEVKPTINCSEEEFVASEGCRPPEMGIQHPFYDDYWKAKAPDLASIKLPMLACASFSDQGLHTRGTFNAFMQASAEKKWVYTHRDLKWDAYYSKDVMELTKRFFDCFVKGENDNGFLASAPVRLEVRSARDAIHAIRDEQEWPLARTHYKNLFLQGSSPTLTLGEGPVTSTAESSYDAKLGRLEANYVFAEDTELTGYMTLKLWVETRAGAGPVPDDMVLFVCVNKLDKNGDSVRFYGSVGNHQDMVARGLLAVSRRALNEAESTHWQPVLANTSDEKLSPGEIVPIQIAINPSSTFFVKGEGLQLIVSPNEIIPSPPYRKDNSANRGEHVIHFGGQYDSHLTIPMIDS